MIWFKRGYKQFFAKIKLQIRKEHHAKAARLFWEGRVGYVNAYLDGLGQTFFGYSIDFQEVKTLTKMVFGTKRQKLPQSVRMTEGGGSYVYTCTCICTVKRK